NCKAVLEALLYIRTSFVRTPKYNVVGLKNDEWKSKKNYHRRRNYLPLFEMGFGLWFTFSVIVAVIMKAYLALPFLFLFQFGFLYTSLLSLFQTGASLDTRKAQS
ncbi:MAG: hypothetical protein KC609_17990, partial [Myxococcales bacterium]|nr:hypothetical protein [Myxococcales bacterium]